jgi:hypothetical protein
VYPGADFFTSCLVHDAGTGALNAVWGKLASAKIHAADAQNKPFNADLTL